MIVRRRDSARSDRKGASDNEMSRRQFREEDNIGPRAPQLCLRQSNGVFGASAKPRHFSRCSTSWDLGILEELLLRAISNTSAFTRPHIYDLAILYQSVSSENLYGSSWTSWSKQREGKAGLRVFGSIRLRSTPY